MKETGEFKKFADALRRHAAKMWEGQDNLFRTAVDKDELWEVYLGSFPEGTNPVFRERREFDCGCCRQFIKSFGNTVAIKDGKVVTLWDISEGLEYPYDIVAEKLAAYVRSKPVEGVLVTREAKFGTAVNRELDKDGNVRVWNHFSAEIPASLVISRGSSPEAVMAEFRTSKELFERGLTELTETAMLTVLELIEQGSLYRGEEHKKAVDQFLTWKRRYNDVAEEDRQAWLWKNSIGNQVARIRNTAIGTLLIDLSADVDIDEAVTKFEKVMAPTNYKRPKAVFTKKMVEEAENRLMELGLMDALQRRHSRLDDISVNNVIFVNRDARTKMSGGSVFDGMKEDAAVNPKTFKKVEEMSITDFIDRIVPESKKIELLMESRLQSGLVSLIAPAVKDSGRIFKWDNNFSWSYISDTTDSMKQNVKEAGGNVEGVLRFSIQWNDDRGYNPNDYDAHCHVPGGGHIFYGSKRDLTTGGELDVDIRNPVRGKPAVENITWPDMGRLKEGVYTLSVHNYFHSGGTQGFDAEIEFDGQIHSLSYHKDLPAKQSIVVAEVEYTRKNGFRIVSSLDSSTFMTTREVWGISTNKWAEVSTLLYSPNYWDEQSGKGNRHYLFMLKDCRNDSSPRGFYNEFLRDDLITHKRVFEALGARTRVEDSQEQLSGLGFSETQRNHVYARVEGSFSRILKINF